MPSTATIPRSIGEIVRSRARNHPERLFVWCGRDRLTYGELDARSDSIAAGLAEYGVRRGDRVAIMSANRIEVVETLFACAKLGAIHVPVNVFLKGEFLRYQLDDAEAVAVVADEAGCRAVLAVASELPSLEHVLAVDAPEGVELPVSPFGRLRASTASAPAEEPGPETTLSIVYTSGTTGMPKGCMLSHAWYLNGARTSNEMFGYSEDDVLFTALPLFHGWALGTVMAALLHGLTVVVEPAFSATGILDRIVETGATVFGGVGMMGMAMLALPPTGADRAHRLRAALLIPFTTEQQGAFESRFGVRVLAQLYGQTETGAITFSRLGEPADRSSVGRASPSFDVRILDEADEEVDPNEVGEIAVRARLPHAMFQGYWRKPEATVAAWRNLWHHTGDYGRMDADGFVTFVDRKKDSIRRRGENVSSLEVERAIVQHPKIAEVAVHAVRSDMTEDEIKACVVVAGSADPTPRELFEYFRENLPYFAIPRYVEIVPELPKNATMRVMKHVLRRRGVTDETWDLEALGLTVAPAERR